MKFKIPVNWIMSSYVNVEANSLDEAIEVAQYQWAELPVNGEYIDDSFDVNIQCAEEMNDNYGVLPEYED